MRIQVDFRGIQRLAEDMEHLKGKVDRIISELNDAGKALDWELGSVDEAVARELKALLGELDMLSASFGDSRNYLWDVRYEFARLESEMVKRVEALPVSLQQGGVERAATMNRLMMNAITPRTNGLEINTFEHFAHKPLNVKYEKIIETSNGVIEPWLKKMTTPSLK